MPHQSATIFDFSSIKLIFSFTVSLVRATEIRRAPMVSSMNHYRDQAPLSLSLSLGAVAERKKKLRRAGAAGGAEGAAGGEFTCKTCGRSFPTFQALGGHRTSHLRGRHGLALALAGDHYSLKPKKTTSSDDQKPAAVHQCHVCGLSFEMGQALGGHMRRHREEAGAVALAPPVLLQLFV
ncbi:hypothetical protein QYE76_060664 [Lolium multiflorum]|uniref:C2H2-type domain-containing protein n=1 Tax=Lolium multiflorum TaxID=4521 RepID=A0AAD8W6H3_LOLMU|nr:hypothetical protein QYE76_060664 [Lolium multiflorum]